MASFDSGVAYYIEVTATVKVYFPVDSKDNTEICCCMCPYLSADSRICRLNGSIVEYPKTNIGGKCPLVPTEVEA